MALRWAWRWTTVARRRGNAAQAAQAARAAPEGRPHPFLVRLLGRMMRSARSCIARRRSGGASTWASCQACACVRAPPPPPPPRALPCARVCMSRFLTQRVHRAAQVPGVFYVNKHLEKLMFDELRQFSSAASAGAGGFLPAMKQLANVAALYVRRRRGSPRRGSPARPLTRRSTGPES